MAALDVPRATREALTLIVTELVTNAIRHAGAAPGTAVDLNIATGPGPVRVTVRDRGRGFDPSSLDHRPDPLAAGGQGLVIVAALAAAWGVERNRDGCTVWCDVASERVPESAVADVEPAIMPAPA